MSFMATPFQRFVFLKAYAPDPCQTMRVSYRKQLIWGVESRFEWDFVRVFPAISQTAGRFLLGANTLCFTGSGLEREEVK